MNDLTFVTGNAQKFSIAQPVFADRGINLLQVQLDIDEIQGEVADKIVRDKLQKAYSATGKPTLVNDDSWSFSGLGGFPGPYMKSIMHWFTAEDFLHLTFPLQDRRVTLSQWIGYQDADGQKLFTLDYTGIVLPELRGTSGSSLEKIISMPGDNGRSIAESYDNGANTTDREVAEGYRQFIDWYQGRTQ